jgi:tetrahydromethanopterin S-methyltransferase subunit F
MNHLLSRDATLADWLMALAIMGFVVGMFSMGPWT